MTSLEQIAAPFERITDAAASALVADLYGIPGATVERLDTDRDDGFRVRTAFGDLVLKVANPADDPLLVNLQTAALGFAGEATPPLPLQRLLPTVEGELEPIIVDARGRERVVRMLTWLPGAPVWEVCPDAAQLELLGASLGRLSAALADFRHPAAHREFAWDAAQLPLLRPLLDEFGCDETRAAVAWFERAVAPRLHELPHQVIYNDFHLGNVLADAENPDFVTGIIDFGDVVHSARVVDLALAISYLMQPAHREPAEIERFVAGFERHVLLTPLERELLPAFVAARFTTRILINAWLARDDPQRRDEVRAASEGSRRALATVLAES